MYMYIYIHNKHRPPSSLEWQASNILRSFKASLRQFSYYVVALTNGIFGPHPPVSVA